MKNAQKTRWTISGLAVALGFFSGLAHAADRPSWSVVFHIAVDEEEISSYTIPTIKQILESAIPASVEVLMDIDAFGPEHDARLILRSGQFPIEVPMPERDSSDPRVLGEFVSWVKQTATGEHLLLVELTHSWGWKGIVQDYTIPNKPDTDSMMALRDFAGVIQSQGLRPDIFFVDSCILGNVEPIEEFKALSRYLILSQGETPYRSFPYWRLFALLGESKLSPRDIAALIPENYAGAFARGGEQADAEGEYFGTTSVAVDTLRWDDFAGEFKNFVKELRLAGFKDFLRANPKWRDGIVDMDDGADVVDLIRRIMTATDDRDVKLAGTRLLQMIGYPQNMDFLSGEVIFLDPRQLDRFEIVIQADEIMKTGTEDDPKATVLQKLEASFRKANQDFDLGKQLDFSLLENEAAKPRFRQLVVRGKVTEKTQFVRVWLAGTRNVLLKTWDRFGRLVERSMDRPADYLVARNFPPYSFVLSESHAAGVPFAHGIGINLDPQMDDTEIRAIDPGTGLKGPAFYRALRWNQLTGWADLILTK